MTKFFHGALATICVFSAFISSPPASAQAFPEGQPILDVSEVALLKEIEVSGFRFADAIGAKDADSLASLQDKSAVYRDLTQTIGADVTGLRAEMKANGRPLFEVTDGNVGRVIDLRWLRSPYARMRLVGVVNRLDKRDFDDVESCGETRLIYRMAYTIADPAFPKPLSSRMPFNLNVVYRVAKPQGGDCAAAARAWIPERRISDTKEKLSFLRNGPLDRARLTLKQIELNAQIVRFPSGQETEFGGQAAYVLRIFRADLTGGALKLTPRPLENTPDLAKLAADQALRARLIDYLASHTDAIDRGVFTIPEEFLATKAISYSTFGSARLANHPYAQLLKDSDLAKANFEKTSFIKTPKAMIERLDNASCTGCHQSNATAGFHFIGFDDGATSNLNLLKTAVSPHFYADEKRRDAYVRAVAAGREPNRFRPLSSTPPAEWNGVADGPPRYAPAAAGMACVADSAKGAFANGWNCGGGLSCTTLGANGKVPIEFGQCSLTDEKKIFAGHACFVGEIVNGPVPYNDRFKILRQINSFAPKPTQTQYNCRPPKIGVPAGLAYRQCTEDDKNFRGFTANGKPPPEICGLAGGKLFDDCVATNNFNKCLRASVVRGERPACGRDIFCREDYMCQGIPDDTPGVERVKDYGFCSPTYFLFQMRIDGHPDPLKKV
ncbi:hypothetical protein [Terrarubrum flagellatum]|uniref:hypothetical protein n=1 Tax=Terrirubrum flagellatum TaxID=2895980 RepID=UPI003145647E